jgi:DNA sulfur modification protein DndB
MGVLHLPQVYRSAFIIDGQHRLYGYSRAKPGSHHTIPVVAFHNMPHEEQARIFVDINHEQKSVAANTLRSIMSEFHWGSDDASRAISALKTRLIDTMNDDPNSPFYKRIITSDEPKTPTRCLTLDTLIKWGLSSRMGFFGKVKGKKLMKTGYLTDVTYEATLKRSASFFNHIFGYIEQELPQQWSAGGAEGGFIAMNVGVSAIMRTVDSVIDYLVRYKDLKPEDLTGEELATEVIPYLVPVVDFVSDLDSESLLKLRTYFGSGATERVLKEFQNAIHAEFDDFSPEGLEQWIKDRTGQFTVPSYEIGHNRIEPLIHQFIRSQLIKEFGEQRWWSQGVPKEVQKQCSATKIDSGSEEPVWNFLSTIHYHSIIRAKWDIFSTYFTPPGMENASKEKKLSWMNQFNSIRQKYSHPQRDIVKQSEYDFLVQLLGWLEQKLVG